MTEKSKTKLVRCLSCRGQKVKMGIGFSETKCEPCKGIGYVEEVIDPIGYLEDQEKKTVDHIPDQVDTHENQEGIQKTRPYDFQAARRGRPPRKESLL